MKSENVGCFINFLFYFFFCAFQAHSCSFSRECVGGYFLFFSQPPHTPLKNLKKKKKKSRPNKNSSNISSEIWKYCRRKDSVKIDTLMATLVNRSGSHSTVSATARVPRGPNSLSQRLPSTHACTRTHTSMYTRSHAFTDTRRCSSVISLNLVPCTSSEHISSVYFRNVLVLELK